MTTYRLVSDRGLSYKEIATGRNRVGRVVRKPDGSGYFARIGHGAAAIEVTAATEREAFEECAARAMGHQSAAALHVKNRQVRHVKRAMLAAGDHLLDQIMHGPVETRFAALDRLGPRGMTVALAAMTRSLRRRTR